MSFSDPGTFRYRLTMAQAASFADAISPAPPEPAKAAWWVPKPGDLVVMSGMVRTNEGEICGVTMDGDANVRVIKTSCLRPEAAPPAAAPAPYVAASVHGMDTRGVLSQLADARSKRDQFEALSVKRELELGDKEREIARLRSALRDATLAARKLVRL